MSSAIDAALRAFAALISLETRLMLWVVGVLTILLVGPMLFMVPTEIASQSPDNEVTRAQQAVADRFLVPTYEVPLVVEAADGDALSKPSLLALLDRSADLRAAEDVGPLLASRFVPELGIEAVGLYTIADAVDRALNAQGSSLTEAEPQQVAAAAAATIEGTSPLLWGLADGARRDSAGRWSSPAVLVIVEADNEALGGGGSFVAIGSQDLRKEEFARRVLELVRGEQEVLRAWTVGADVNLTSIEQGTRAGPYIGLTVLAVLLVLLLVFRSYWLTAVSGLALGALMIWLKGITNLIGLESDQILATIVPIGMISFGVDSTFHVWGRIRGEGVTEIDPRRAARAGTVAVMSGVVLALTSDSAAFLANLTSPIESVRQFGLAAAIAALAAFVLLGLSTPLAVAEIDAVVGSGPLLRRGQAGDLALGALASAAATASVLLIVFVSPAAGAGLLAGYGLIFVAVPIRLARGRRAGAPRLPVPARSVLTALVELVAVWFGRRALPTLFSVAGLTGFCLFFAVGVRPSFEVTDFFAPDVDFAVGIERYLDHASGEIGEPAAILIETDLTDPVAVGVVARFIDDVRHLDTDLLARADGSVVVDGGAVDVIRAAMDDRNTVPGAVANWRADLDGDGLPDTSGELDAMLSAALAGGVVGPGGGPLWTPDDVGAAVSPPGIEGRWATQLGLAVPDTSTQQVLGEVRGLVEPMTDGLARELAAVTPSSNVVLTGSPIFRDEQLRAISRSLLLSLPVALTVCLLLVVAFTGSFRLAVLTTIPVLLVVTWLYAFMAAAGFGINVVTATIGAISIGIGIDFATHMTMRMREEARKHHDPDEALRAAVAGTGTALTGSALTSVIGFSVLALAPMPLFATYGLLTAMMIVFALLASVIVLPSALLVFGDLPGPPAIHPTDLRSAGVRGSGPRSTVPDGDGVHRRHPRPSATVVNPQVGSP